jgi:hypothetical protein
VDGESSIARIVAFVDDRRYEQLMKLKAKCRKTKFGDIAGAFAPGLHGLKAGKGRPAKRRARR